MVAEKEAAAEERVVVREVDRKTAVRLRALEVAAEKAKYKAAVAKSRAEARDAARAQRFQAKMELAKLRANLNAGEKARAHIAVAGPFYLLVLVSGFLLMLATDTIGQDNVSVASVLLTTLVTMIGSNLRSIISEGGPVDTNGHDEKKPKTKPKD